MVVLRAYMICLRCMWGSVSTAPPDYFIVLHRQGMAMAGGFSLTAIRFAEIYCAPTIHGSQSSATNEFYGRAIVKGC